MMCHYWDIFSLSPKHLNLLLLIVSILCSTFIFGRELSLKPMIANTPVVLHSSIVHNNDSIIITSFKAYIVIPTLTDTFVHLLDIEDNLICSIPDDAESVIIGIDSMQTVKTNFSGALDPINGMFWTWNSGYINVKIEGISQRSIQRNHIFQMHLGGFTAPHQVSIPLRIPRNTPIKLSIDIAPCIDALLSNYQGTVMSPGKHAHELMCIFQRSITIEQ